MPRGARFIFENAFYHVFNRGINKQNIFLSEQDFAFFLKKLKQLKSKYDHSLYAYCLMPNHFHISIQTRKTPISKIMASLTTSYSMYFNKKNNHLGSVFQNRYKSILIENDTYFMYLSKYIYLNPVKAGLVSNPLEYTYSSVREAVGREPLSYLDNDVIRLMGETKGSHQEYKRFILGEIDADFSKIDRLFEEEEAVAGSESFATRARQKYSRRKKR